MDEYITALCARDFKGASVQWFSENKFVMQKNFTEKRFFYWVEDNTSVSLRAKSGSYGGGVRDIDY